MSPSADDQTSSLPWSKRLGLLALTILASSPMLVAVLVPGPSGQVPGPASREVSGVDGGGTPQPAAEDVARHYVVEVTGSDFEWKFHILEPETAATRPGDSAPSRADSDSLTLPAGSTIDWRLTSDDYIYTFTIPALGIHEVAAPGVLRQWTSGPLEPAEYDLLADPICSFRFYHDELMGRVIVERIPQATTSDSA